MRMLVLKQGQDLQSLATRLGAAGGAASIERLKALNPHLDLGRLQPGAVLLVPDGVDDADSVAGAVFDGLASDLKAGLSGAAARVRAGHGKADAVRKEVVAVTKSATFKRVLEGDADLKKQVAAADNRFKAEQTLAKQADDSLVALARLIDDELAVLGKLVR